MATEPLNADEFLQRYRQLEAEAAEKTARLVELIQNAERERLKFVTIAALDGLPGDRETVNAAIRTVVEVFRGD